MAKAKITIIGDIDKFEVNDNGNVIVIIKADTSKGVPKGLKELGSSTYRITVNQKMWKKVSDKLQGNRIMFTGEPKAAVTVKGVPFTLVNCFDISVIESKDKENQSESKSIPSKPVQTQKEIQKYTKIDSEKNTPNKNKLKDIIKEWHETNEIIQIPFQNIILVEKAHLNHANFKLGKLDASHIKPMTVRQISENKYALIMGLRSFVTAKLLDVETVSVILCDITFNELTAKLGIAEKSEKDSIGLRQKMD